MIQIQITPLIVLLSDAKHLRSTPSWQATRVWYLFVVTLLDALQSTSLVGHGAPQNQRLPMSCQGMAVGPPRAAAATFLCLAHCHDARSD